MTTFNEGYAQLIPAFEQMAAGHPDIVAAVIIGSRARTDHPSDEWSDLDMLLFVTDAETFANQTDWYEALGEVWLSFVSRTAGGDPERRVLYAGGLDVDFAINSVGALEYLANNPLPPDAVDIFRRGLRIVMDKSGLIQSILDRPLPPPSGFSPPDQASFSNLVHDFWYHTLWTAKHLRRGEIWWAKTGCDMHLKNLLNEMLKWHAHARQGTTHDTWMGARFLEEWADPRAVAELSDSFGHYDRQDIARALLATMQLFQWLELETAQAWGYHRPEAQQQAVAQLVEQLLAPIEA